MSRVIVIGGGLAGLSAAAALAEAGLDVDLFEARGFLGGRASSYPCGPDESAVIDNCQHILLRCCVNLLDFYHRLGVEDRIRFHRRFHFLEPGGRISTLQAGPLPPPLHFAGSFPGLKFLAPADKLRIARALLALPGERRREDLERITMLEWLREKRQTPRAITRFWSPVLVSAVNEDLDRMAASHGFQVFRLGFLASARGHEMGIPETPLGELYGMERWRRFARVRLHPRLPVERVIVENGAARGVAAGGERHAAEAVICALPFERAGAVAPELGLDLGAFQHSPITGIHLWFDRPVTPLPHGALLDRTIQWFFSKDGGRYLLLVVSASRSLVEMPRGPIIDLALRELAEFLPDAASARLERSHVVKEVRATFSARPGLEAMRPPARTAVANLFLAGDWTRSGWPATMEGAVRSGYLAAEAAAEALGAPRRFLLPDIA